MAPAPLPKLPTDFSSLEKGLPLCGSPFLHSGAGPIFGVYQGVLKTVGAGTEDISCYRLVLTDIEIQLYALRPLGMVIDRIGIPRELLAAAGSEIKPLGVLQFIIA